MQKFVRIRTKNHTAAPLRRAILTDYWAICRLGSVTSTEDVLSTRERIIEVNTPEAVRNSSSKLRMKRCFVSKNVKQADGYTTSNGRDFFPIINPKEEKLTVHTMSYPVVAKRVFGCQGNGMELLEDEKMFTAWLKRDHDWHNWIFERFYNYGREYRLHVGRGVGVFLSWRKLRTKEAPDRWFFNNSNSNWVGTEHPMFDRPKCWKAMEKAAIAALESTTLDIGACDLRVQTSKVTNPDFIVCEINSAPALGEVGIEKYKEVIKTIINSKANE